jgi:hypothetical protein
VRNLISGMIGILWGGALILARIFGGSPSGSASYQSGSWFGTAIGVAMFAAGIYYVRKGLLARKASGNSK